MARVKIQVPVEPTEQPTDATHRQIALPHFEAKKLLYIGGALVIVILLLVLINDRNHLKSELKKESSTTQNDTQKYQSEVAALAEVPVGITPKSQILTDTALQQLASKDTAFKNAQSGDVVLVYDKTDNTRYVVIYRPTTKKIVLATAATVTTNTQP